MESRLEKEIREWRENRHRDLAALAAARERVFPIASAPAKTGRRVQVNGQDVLVVSRPRRPLSS
jgi:hypothetical protein